MLLYSINCIYLKTKPTPRGFKSHARFMQPFTISWLSFQCWCIVVFITFAYHATCLQKYFFKRIHLRTTKHQMLNNTHSFRFYTTYSMNLKIELLFMALNNEWKLINLKTSTFFAKENHSSFFFEWAHTNWPQLSYFTNSMLLTQKVVNLMLTLYINR